MSSKVTAVFDACVLYSAPMRDLLVELGYQRVIRARWTAEIHEEWMGNLLANRPDLDPKKLDRTRAMMDSVKGCLVSGHLGLISTLTLPDPDDRHILAAAIKSRANHIVTINLKDFPQSVLDDYKIEALHPDFFLLKILKAREVAFCSVAKAVRDRLKNPSKTAEEYLLTLEEQGLTRTVGRLRDFVDVI